MQVCNLDRIRQALDPPELIKSQEDGFVAYSQGRVVVPPVGYLYFEAASGDCHIKYGYIKGDDYFLVKIATGFYKNPNIGMPVGNGMMALFSQHTGKIEALLLDEGYLTEMRTAAAGAVAAKYLAPKKVSRIGIVGTGVQARLQLEMLRYVTGCRNAIVWGRDRAKRERYKWEMSAKGFLVDEVARIEDLTANCNLIVTTTSAREPILYTEHIRPGSHITAMGADAPGKQELDENIFARANIRVVDSASQCIDHGDSSYAVRAGVVCTEDLRELGNVISRPELGRTHDSQITVADLTGVAVQDIQVAKLVYNHLSNNSDQGQRPNCS